MITTVLKRQSILPRIDGIRTDIQKLQTLSAMSEEEFCNEQNDHFDIAKLRLREALEGVFHIGAHILSRIEGGRTTEYKDIAKQLGDKKIVPREFADKELAHMAGYRNRLTHFYAEIDPKEMYEILKNNLDDFNIFLEAIKALLENPSALGLSLDT
jgi:uncharacterized protein YutE (UPF0331/DUF86 family)